jgi:DNA polymerase-3 subunit epsilon
VSALRPLGEFDDIIVLDTETTGRTADDAVVEIAWASIDDEMEVIEQVATLIDPGRPIPPEVTAVHGITDQMVVGAPTLERFMTEVASVPFATGSILVIGHNVDFDYHHVAPYISDGSSLCTLRLARFLFPVLGSHTLQTLVHHCGLGEVQTHRAAGDVELTLRLLRRLAAEADGTLEGLLALSEVALAEMRVPFGDYRREPIRDLTAEQALEIRERYGDRLSGDFKAALDLHHPLSV